MIHRTRNRYGLITTMAFIGIHKTFSPDEL
jgi:hypothetical protein